MINLFLIILSIVVSLYANEKWIDIEQINNTKTYKSNTKLPIDLSKVKSINKMIKNASAIKQLIDTTRKKEKETTNKNWFILNSKVSN